MLFILLVFIVLGLGKVIFHLINLRNQNELIIEILDNIHRDINKKDGDGKG